MSNSKVWVLDPVTKERVNSTYRISTTVEGYPIWFESDDIELQVSVEAFAGIFLLPALHHQAQLRIEEPVDRQWLANLRKLTEIYSSWWGYNSSFPIIVAETVTSNQHITENSNDLVLGLCFTGGVDSFYSLLEYPAPTDFLIFAHGYDIPLNDWPRLEDYRRSLQIIATRSNKTAVIIRTNLREHPLFKSVSWERTHGSALAALGLILSSDLDALVIPPSFASTRLCPWGSHPETDPLYSTSTFKVFHHSTPLGRLERIQKITNFDLAQKHLRVCYVNISLTGNCSTCEKCVMTMAGIDSTGQLNSFQTFSSSQSLKSRIYGLGSATQNLIPLWEDIAVSHSNPKIKTAIYTIVRHSFESKSRRQRFSSFCKRVTVKLRKMIS